MLPLNLQNKMVLIVEDDEMSFLYLKLLFMLTKCTILHATTGSEAIEMFRANRFDLILMDIHLPDVDGTDVTREIRLTDSKIPIIAQTAGKTPDEKDQAMQAGCSDVIVKPFTMEVLFTAVAKFVEGC